MSDLSADVPPSKILTQQEKLDALFGITQGQDIDTFLSGLSLDNAQQQNDVMSALTELSAVEQTMKDKIAQVQADPILNQVGYCDLSSQIVSIDHSMAELEDIVNLSKDIIRHVHASILATPLIDSEAVQAYSKLVESIHINIAEFISIYRDKQNFANKIRYALFDQQQKKDLLRYKADLQIEVQKAKDKSNAIDTSGVVSDAKAWDSDRVCKMVQEELSRQNALNDIAT